MSNWKEGVIDRSMAIKAGETYTSGIKDKIKKLQEELKAIDLKINRDKEFIISTLEDNGVDKLVYDGVTVTMSHSPYSVIIADDADIPQEYKKIVETISVDKKALINNRDSINIDGVEFVQTKKLTIKV